MRVEWHTLREPDLAAFWTAVEFLEGRLSDATTVQWAVNLGPGRRAERLAIAHVLHRSGVSGLGDPWRTVWGLIEESFWGAELEFGTASHHEIRQRIVGGDRTGALVSMISTLVAPRMRVEPRSVFAEERDGPPEVLGDVMHASLTSQPLVTPDAIGLSAIEEVTFLVALANALEAEVRRGMDAGRRIGWAGTHRSMWRLGFLYRIRFDTGTAEGDDSDAFHRGIAPAVKLLFAVVERIAALDVSAAKPIIGAWRLRDTPIDTRLWATAASNSSLVSIEEAEAFLLSIDDRMFWDIHAYPEVATLRARRFGELSEQARDAIANRLQDRPPSSHWLHTDDAERLEQARLYWAVRELRRVEVGGGVLPSAVRTWVGDNVARFDDLAEMDEDEGILGGPDIGAYVPSGPPDPMYDSLQGIARLEALESAWSGASEWGEDPARRWLEQEGRPSELLADIQSISDGGAGFPRVWLRFGLCHRPSGDSARDRREARAVLALVEGLSDETLRYAIEGIADWMSAWRDVMGGLRNWSRTWLQVWPVAVDSTNSHYSPEDVGNLSVLVRGSDDEDLDAYNTPAADLIGAFLRACGSATNASRPFRSGTNLRRARDAIQSSEGQSLLIARHRLIEWLPYFLQADKRWAKNHLIAPLRADEPGQAALWRAVSRRRLTPRVLGVIGDDVAAHATNADLDARTRNGLVFSVVAESLNALREPRAPAIPYTEVQQMLRLVDDDARAHAAETVVRFVVEVSGKPGTSGAQAFMSGAASFLADVWPQDRNLVTPGVSRAFAELPLRAGDSFAEAVTAIRHLLVPFDCYSIMEYGFGRDGPSGALTLEAINTGAKAEALLDLLSGTVPIHESATVPLELSEALAQIRAVKPAMGELPRFRRLEAVSRR